MHTNILTHNVTALVYFVIRNRKVSGSLSFDFVVSSELMNILPTFLGYPTQLPYIFRFIGLVTSLPPITLDRRPCKTSPI